MSLVSAAAAQVYREVDEEGNVTFTDRPQGESEAVEIGPTNTAPPPPANVFPDAPEEPANAAGGSYEVAITNPAHETIIPRGPGNFSVSASVSPGLQTGHKLQLLMDGSPRQEPQTGSTWNLTNVFRGEHNLTVAVIDSKGKQLSESEAVTVFVFRPSTNDRSRRPRPTPRN